MHVFWMIVLKIKYCPRHVEQLVGAECHPKMMRTFASIKIGALEDSDIFSLRTLVEPCIGASRWSEGIIYTLIVSSLL